MTKYTKPMDEDMKRCMERLREINRGRTEHGYLDGREQQMLDRREFFGGWEDADSRRIQLEPLEKFDHPELHVVRMGQPEWDPVEEIASQIRKGMAGAPKSERVDAAVLRKALQRGRLGRKQQRCVNEMVASFRIWEMHFPFTTWGLSMYELARVVVVTYGGKHCWAPWLNLWADTPQRPLPAPPRRLPWAVVKAARALEESRVATQMTGAGTLDQH